jgi:hypothetical protein
LFRLLELSLEPMNGESAEEPDADLARPKHNRLA